MSELNRDNLTIKPSYLKLIKLDWARWLTLRLKVTDDDLDERKA